MSGHRHHLLLRHRRLKNWAAVLAMVALVAWVVEIASHLHVHQEVQASAHSTHFCEMCAAFQAGASSSAIAPVIPKLKPEASRIVGSLPNLILPLTHSYRSRAPPLA